MNDDKLTKAIEVIEEVYEKIFDTIGADQIEEEKLDRIAELCEVFLINLKADKVLERMKND